MNGQELAKYTQGCVAAIDQLYKEEDDIREACREEEYRIRYQVYRPQMVELEDRERQAIKENQDRANSELAKKQEHVNEFSVTVMQTKRILMFFQLDTTKNLDFAPEEIKYSENWGDKDKYLEDMGYFVNDDYLKIKIFIGQNDKLTNKYSLFILGKCLFGDNLITLERHYMSPISPFGLSIEKVLKEAPTIPTLKKSLDKMKPKWLKEILDVYNPVKEDYLDTLKNYKPFDFTRLMTATCHCGYFLTIWDYENKDKDTGLTVCPRCQLNMTRIQKEII